MEVNNVSLAAVGVKLEQYPTDFKPEIAFAGKSNVGKSTLINSMIGRKSLARTSSSLVKQEQLIFMMLRILFTLLTCLDMDMPKLLRQKSRSGAI